MGTHSSRSSALVSLVILVVLFTLLRQRHGHNEKVINTWAERGQRCHGPDNTIVAKCIQYNVGYDHGKIDLPALEKALGSDDGLDDFLRGPATFDRDPSLHLLIKGVALARGELDTRDVDDLNSWADLSAKWLEGPAAVSRDYESMVPKEPAPLPPLTQNRWLLDGAQPFDSTAPRNLVPAPASQPDPRPL